MEYDNPFDKWSLLLYNRRTLDHTGFWEPKSVGLPKSLGGRRYAPVLHYGDVAQWQSRGLISPWLAVQIRPSPLN